MCDACRWPEAVQRMRAASLVASSGGLLASKTLMERALDDVQRMQHVSRPQSEQLWTIERDLGMLTERPEKWGEEEEMPKKKHPPDREQAVEVAAQPGHNPETGECPLTDRDKAVPVIEGMIASVVTGLAMKALEAFVSTGEAASFTVTCRLSEDPDKGNRAAIAVSGKLTVGVPGAEGSVSVEDRQVRMRGAE